MSFCIKYSFKLFLFTLSFPHARAIASLSATTCICTIVPEGEKYFGQNECFVLEQRYNSASKRGYSFVDIHDSSLSRMVQSSCKSVLNTRSACERPV